MLRVNSKIKILENENNLNNLICSDCNQNIILDKNRGDTICEQCGLIISEQLIDQGPEWRAFNKNQQQERMRIGSPMNYLLHDKGLCTNIGWKDQDINGNMCDVIEDPKANNPVNNIEKEEMKKVLVRLIDRLPEQEKLVIALYYFEELTLREIGQVMNITESRVSQIHTKAIAFLKTKLATELLA